MEEYEYKLNSNNPILIAQAVWKLVEKIKEISCTIKNRELEYLKNKSCDEDPLVAIEASKALLTLTEAGIVNSDELLLDLVSSSPQAKSHKGLIIITTEVLLKDLRTKLLNGQSYRCPFSIHAGKTQPQHPLIRVISQNWPELLNEIKYFGQDDARIRSHCIESFRPIFTYSLCNLSLELPDLFRLKLWKLMLQTIEFPNEFFYSIVSWLQLNEANSELLNVAINRINHGPSLELLILWQTSLLKKILSKDPRDVIFCLVGALERSGNFNSQDCMLIMLAECIQMCPSTFLVDLLKLVKIVLKNSSNRFSSATIKFSLLMWMLHPQVLPVDCSKIIKEIFELTENSETKIDELNEPTKLFKAMICTNESVYLPYKLAELSKSWNNAKPILNWLNKVKTATVEFLKRSLLILGAIFLKETDPQILLKTLPLLLTVTDAYSELSSSVLILILHKLSKTAHPELHLELLTALPKMAVLKENLQLVLQTLKAVSEGPENLKIVSLSLFYELWGVNRNCFPFLQNILLSKCRDGNDSWEFYIMKAEILKKILLKRPEQHGRELIGHLNEILNRCIDEKGALASALALQGIAALCRAEMVDINTTWEALSPQFKADERPVVIISFCNLLAEIPKLKSITENYDRLVENAVSKLFDYTKNDNLNVIQAAFKALGAFSLEEVSCQLVNSDYNEVVNESNQIQFCDPFNHIEGNFWVTFLEKCDERGLNAAGDFLTVLIESEISNYTRSTYNITKNRKEPTKFDYLPVYSIVRALGYQVKFCATKGEHLSAVYLQCLRILSEKYSKPLPPMDWCFLQELVHKKEARAYCITVASHQVLLSGSARRFIENFIYAITSVMDTCEDIEIIYTNLTSLGDSIQPVVLQPFIEKSLAFALNNCNKNLFEMITLHIKRALDDKNFHDVNQSVLAQAVLDITSRLNGDSEFFESLLNCVASLPTRYRDILISPDVWNRCDHQELEKAVKILKTFAVTAGEPFEFLNICINNTWNIKHETEFIFKNISELLQTFRNHASTLHWLLDLIGNIQAMIIDDGSNLDKVIFLCDVFILAVTIFSNYNTLVGEVVHEKFTQGFLQLLKEEQWDSKRPQVMEWVYFMANCENLPEKYLLTFYCTLVALRHDRAFRESGNWMKYVGSECCLVKLFF